MLVRTAAIILLAGFPAGGSPYVPLTAEHMDPTPVIIEVPAQDLARCMATVAQVLSSPLDHPDDPVAVAVSSAYTGPSVTCVVKSDPSGH